MRLTRVIFLALIITAAGLIFTHFSVRATPEEALAGTSGAMPGGAASSATATFLPMVTKSSAQQTYSFRIDRAKVPNLYYADLTYVVHLGRVSGLVATINGAPLTGTYSSASGDFVFTTKLSGAVSVQFISDSSTTAISVQKAALKGNKAWAWSHGMDDNVNLQAQVALIKAKGWRASLMMIAKDINDTRDEGWILDKPALRDLRNQGWSLADHSWDHNCSGSDTAALKKTIIDGYNKLMEIVSTSSTPTYQIITFAAPCFISAYDPIFSQVMAAGTTTLRFNESQGNPLMNVDGADYTSGTLTASAMSASAVKVGRDTTIETDPTKTIATLDWMAANKAAGRHFWFVTLSHGGQEANLAQVLNHAYTKYGPGGSDELWMAPSDEIYSYLLVRDSTVVTAGTLASAP